MVETVQLILVLLALGACAYLYFAKASTSDCAECQRKLNVHAGRLHALENPAKHEPVVDAKHADKAAAKPRTRTWTETRREAEKKAMAE